MTSKCQPMSFFVFCTFSLKSKNEGCLSIVYFHETERRGGDQYVDLNCHNFTHHKNGV